MEAIPQFLVENTFGYDEGVYAYIQTNRPMASLVSMLDFEVRKP